MGRDGELEPGSQLLDAYRTDTPDLSQIFRPEESPAGLQPGLDPVGSRGADAGQGNPLLTARLVRIDDPRCAWSGPRRVQNGIEHGNPVHIR